MNELLQHVIVTVVATGACAFVARRLVGVVGAKGPRCDSCPSSKPAPAATTVIPLSALRMPSQTRRVRQMRHRGRL